MSGTKIPRHQSTGTSQVLANGLRLLSTIAKANGEFSVREIGRILDLSPTVTHRLVATLHKYHYLEKNHETGKYLIGIESFRVGNSYAGTTGLESVAKPLLYAAAQRYGVNCFLGKRKGTSIVYLYDFTATRRNSIRIAAGTEVPLDATSMGMAILARLDPKQVESYKKFTLSEGIRSEANFGAAFEENLHYARTHGYAHLRSEIFPGVTAVGATVGLTGAEHDTAISFSAPTDTNDNAKVDTLGAHVLETAELLSRQFQQAQT